MSYRSPLLDSAGAVESEGVDAGVPAHYGQPVPEQRRLEAGDGWVDLSHRDVLSIGGPDRLTYLHAMTTQAFEGLPSGSPTEALVLSPHGHIEHAFDGSDDGEVFVASTEPGQGAALAAFLDRMRFMLRVEVTLLTDVLAVVHQPDTGHRIIERHTLGEYAVERGPPSGTWAYDALRIASGRPRIGLDSDHRTIPNELGLLGRAVELDKGCYRGQETVARVHTLGRPPRRLVLLHLDGSADRLPGHLAQIHADGRVVGFIGSSARHHELGPIALALVKRNVPVDSVLLADGVAASQEAIVDPEVGLHVRPVVR